MRLAAAGSLAVLGYALCLEQALYQNHYYLLCQLLLCVAASPGHHPHTIATADGVAG